VCGLFFLKAKTKALSVGGETVVKEAYMWDFRLRVIGRVRNVRVQEALREACERLGRMDHHLPKEIVIIGAAAPHEKNTQRMREQWCRANPQAWKDMELWLA
jgi:hypothetical protein